MHYAFVIWNSVYPKISRKNPIDEKASFVDVLTCVTVTKGQVLKSVSVPWRIHCWLARVWLLIHVLLLWLKEIIAFILRTCKIIEKFHRGLVNTCLLFFFFYKKNILPPHIVPFGFFKVFSRHVSAKFISDHIFSPLVLSAYFTYRVFVNKLVCSDLR